LLAASCALVALGLTGYALAPRWALFVPMAAVIGLGSGAIDAALNGWAARHIPRGTSTGCMRAGAWAQRPGQR